MGDLNGRCGGYNGGDLQKWLQCHNRLKWIVSMRLCYHVCIKTLTVKTGIEGFFRR